MFDPHDVLACAGGVLVVLLASAPIIRRRESDRMRRVLGEVLGADVVDPPPVARPTDTGR